jgi:hypothetical protein
MSPFERRDLPWLIVAGISLLVLLALLIWSQT